MKESKTANCLRLFHKTPSDTPCRTMSVIICKPPCINTHISTSRGMDEIVFSCWICREGVPENGTGDSIDTFKNEPSTSFDNSALARTSCGLENDRRGVNRTSAICSATRWRKCVACRCSIKATIWRPPTSRARSPSSDPLSLLPRNLRDLAHHPQRARPAGRRAPRNRR